VITEPFDPLIRAVREKYLTDKKAGHRNFIVYNALLGFRNNKTGACFPSHTKIAAACGYQRLAVIRALADLEADGFITVARRLGDDGDKTSNSYTFRGLTPAGELRQQYEAGAEGPPGQDAPDEDDPFNYGPEYRAAMAARRAAYGNEDTPF
jgi:hypothetical protein